MPVWEFRIEIGVAALSCAPCEKIEHFHGAERFDEAEISFIEIAEDAIAFEEGVDERAAVFGGVWKEHPEVLDGRADDHVVEVDEKKPFVWIVQDVEAVAVAVDADEFGLPWKGALASIDHLPCGIQKTAARIKRNGVGLTEIVEIVDGGFCRMEDDAVAGVGLFADGVDAADEGAEPLPLIRASAVERKAAHLGEDGEEDAVALRERVAVCEGGGGDDRDFRVLAVEHEIVFVADGGFRPSSWPVEFYDERKSVPRVHFIDAVDVAWTWADEGFYGNAESFFDHIDGQHGAECGERLQRHGKQ